MMSPERRFHLVVRADPRTRAGLRRTGMVLIGLGLLALLLPQVVSISLAWLVGGLLMLAGLISAATTTASWSLRRFAWLKPLLLIAVGLLVILQPVIVTATLGLLLAAYLLLDAVASLGMAGAMRPDPGWGWMLVNGVASAALAAVFMVGWPFSSLATVGVLIGISLMINGAVMLALGRQAEPL